MKRTEAIEQLGQRGWKIAANAPIPFKLPPSASRRHPNLPADFVDFLSGLSTCANRDGTAWFLCYADYEGTSESAFRWDEFEQMSIESADGDQLVLAAINAFWAEHLPFLLSVHSGYAFYAIRTSPERFGEVVDGYEPLFEEASVVAESFSDFLNRFLSESNDERLSPIRNKA